MVAITSSLPTMYGACVLSATYWFREIEHPLQRLEFCSTYFQQWDMQQIFFFEETAKRSVLLELTSSI